MAQLYCIGRGSCGTVWGEKQQQNEEPFSEVAYKASFHERALWRDFNLTNRVHNAFLRMQELMEDFFPGITVPRIPSATHFFKPSSPWWGAEHSPPMFLPPEIPADGGGQAVMRTQRILPLPSSTREILINSYFDPQSQVAALSNPENKDCLIRLYLGADAGYKFTGDGPWRTSLRNFELYFDMACALGRLAFPDMDLNIRLLAQEMAVGLAIIHWEAKCDGMAADWVLGSPSRSELLLECAEEFETMQIAEVTPNSKKGGRSTYLWILDFDKARPIEYDKSCIPLLLGGVTANDPYLPNPKNSPKWLYELFEVTYLQASEEILGRKLYKATDRERADIMELPYFFMEAWEEWAQYSEDLGVNLERWSLVDGEVEVEEAEEIEGDDTGEDGDNEMEDGDERASVRWETPFC
ncbi:hypothetical protein AJ79_02278 [Helicocarpus griseus UAMH5409]|uniref:DUF3669 domain-containing protein n=1 Tax=Helicocarpus griseus UAMH5409 TaxID=1447875 RepID=A0A2B7XV86_9EURO|nr:hypothetical protein AJ79_02278 [Helicocarpus griseus UAMH5409]